MCNELWVEHHKLIEDFEEFMTDLTVDSPISSREPSPEPIPTPDHVRKQRCVRKFEFGLKNLFKPNPIDEKAADDEFQKTVEESRWLTG